MASEIKVDTISEKTSANGITIDGVNIKDSAIATAGSVPLTAIDIDGGTDIGAAIVDADLFIIDMVLVEQIEKLLHLGLKLM